jgi:hypothetical protein
MAGNLLSLRLSAADSSVSYFFNAREFGTTANRPVLSINVIPEPGTVTLLVAGALISAVLMRRRK